MVKKLTNVGNSKALVIDKPLLELMGLTDDEVQVVFSDGSLIVTAVHPAAMPDEVFDRSLNDVFKRRRSALKKLSE